MKKSYLLLLALCLCSFSLFAQDQLSLSDAIKIALDRNFQIRIAQDNIAIAKNNNNWGQAGRYPSVNLTLNQNNGISDQSKNPTSFIQSKIFTSSISGDANVKWTIFNGMKVVYNKDRLELLQAQSEGNAFVIVENTIQSVILGYYNTILQKEKLEVLKKLIKLSRDKYDYYSSKKDFGVVSTFDLLQIKNAYLTDSTSYLNQELAYRNAARNLNLLMSVEVETKYNYSDFLNPVLENYELDTLKNKMLKNNNTILNQYINLELQKNNTDLAKSVMYPVISFQAGATDTKTHFEIANQSRNGGTLNYYGNFTLNFNLFNGGQTRRAIQNAKIQERIAETSLQEQVFTVTNQLTSNYELYLARVAILNIYDELYRSADYNMQLAQDRFERGTISSFDYRDVQLQFLNAAMARLEASYNLINAHTDLMRITGGIVEIQ